MSNTLKPPAIYMRANVDHGYSIQGMLVNNGPDNPEFAIKLVADDGTAQIYASTHLLSALKMYEKWLYGDVSDFLKTLTSMRGIPSDDGPSAADLDAVCSDIEAMKETEGLSEI